MRAACRRAAGHGRVDEAVRAGETVALFTQHVQLKQTALAPAAQHDVAVHAAGRCRDATLAREQRDAHD